VCVGGDCSAEPAAAPLHPLALNRCGSANKEHDAGVAMHVARGR
jgi:hypothetical protein